MLLIGYTWKEKVAMIQERLAKESADMLIVSALDEVACKNYFI